VKYFIAMGILDGIAALLTNVARPFVGGTFRSASCARNLLFLFSSFLLMFKLESFFIAFLLTWLGQLVVLLPQSALVFCIFFGFLILRTTNIAMRTNEVFTFFLSFPSLFFFFFGW
jgi:hypothetical protein